MICIFPEISKAFCLKIRLQVLISESSTMSKLIQRCKSFVVKNRKSLIDTDLLLFAANFAIANFSD